MSNFINYKSPNFSEYTTVEELKGKTIIEIEGMVNESEEIIFTCSDGTKYLMYHQQDCCEYVRLEDVVGNPEDLIGSELLMCEESSNEKEVGKYDNHQTYTYYKFATVKGYVTLRWLGESNGYYSENVDFRRIN